uniref:Glycosyltransferase 61 catalytic domain-containing protein n=1 Tax=Ananas comosus var. bracteatus TaxID=296719 RepID=A0A6V7Q562_ANACO|nr:unnamed protein product [Ananas comosus var. bracteatus]
MALALSLLPAAAPSDIAFLPLKDLRFSNTPMDGNTWFMSSLNDTYEPGETEHLRFPSDASGGRLLCLAGSSASDGTRNAYALAPPHGLRGVRLLRGLTFVSDTYYDYENLWHGLSAVVPFAAWHARNGCVRPARWVLYHQGSCGRGWARGCGRWQRQCSGRRCRWKRSRGSAQVLRGGSGVPAQRGVDDKGEEEEGGGCRLTVARPNNLTFCDQVKLMSETDILASPHGAQLTNMFFMDRNSSVMEFFPTGWLKLAGPGQNVFQWLASYSGMQHRGAWHDPNGDRCPYANATARCMSFHKNRHIGHNTAFLANWTSTVLREEHRRMAAVDQAKLKASQGPCQCD